ncbi:hypothetical protein EIN_167730 [Entamoeba invadens IP1]|uniref:Major facilitator superfamily (MFS) profile domain-containing protein n=1 Tax=Entamoeba invadens IP1 TaxID=370355 RepID=A0A0A1U0P5_ENTIV|nr:hypothetical protein EIN_167730 [Entamoeba invadens IP1]ELP84448.1 hypothetical protein EIN_167730 [Entamoeba invadens IP1]|eukprot:XP_004183794.1 hypothetical protein EIN_167730 [Entamoeba invadens IP1]
MVNVLIKIVLSNFWRYCASSLLFNFGAFLFWIVVPLIATRQGASNLDLAIINAIDYGAMFLLSWVCGFINNYLPGWLLARAGVLIYIFACLLLMFINDNMWILWIMSFMYSFSYVLFWIPIQTSISRESSASDADFWLGIFSGTWTFGQSVGYLCGAFLFTKLGITQSLSISIASLVIILFIYPCWEGSTVFGIDLTLEKTNHKSEDKKEVLNKEIELAESHDENKVIEETLKEKKEMQQSPNNSENASNVIETEDVKNKPLKLIVMGKKERRRLKKRMMQYLIPTFFCSIGCYGTLLSYGSQYFNRIYGTKDSFFPSMKDDPGRYDMFIGVFFCVVYIAFTIGFINFARMKYLFFNRWSMLIALLICCVNHFICGSISNWIVQLICAIMFGLCGAFASQNILNTTSKLSLLTSQISSLYVGLQESLTFNLVAFLLPLIVGPISDKLNDYRIPMFGCSFLGAISVVMCELTWQIYDFVIIQKMDKEDVSKINKLFENIINTDNVKILIDDKNKYNKYCRTHWLTWKQIKVLKSKLEKEKTISMQK